MIEYAYYPGCSLKGTSKAYENSLLEIFKVLNIKLKEIPNWNCCGATAYFGIDKNIALLISARNLDIAKECGFRSMVVPCAGCFLSLKRCNEYVKEDKIGEMLEKAGIDYNGEVEVIHPIEIIINEIGLQEISKRVKIPLHDWKVACYYGCQLVRPYSNFDNPYDPQSLDLIMNALGAETIDYSLKTRCCGGSLTGTIEEVGLRLVYILLKEIKNKGANVIVTVCPLCHFNLEVYQKKMKSKFQEEFNIPVLHFTQAIGYAFGIDPKKLGFNTLIFSPIRK